MNISLEDFNTNLYGYHLTYPDGNYEHFLEIKKKEDKRREQKRNKKKRNRQNKKPQYILK